MKFVTKTAWLGLSAVVSCAVWAATAQADCNCRGGGAIHAVSQPGPSPMQGYPLAPMPDPSFRPQQQVVPVPMPHGSQPLSTPPPPQYAPSPPQQSFPTSPSATTPRTEAVVDSPPATNRFDVAPPAGTLGRTYQRRSRLIDDDKHPRWAAVEVYLPEDADVSARGLKAKWTGKVWRLETETPLLPGVSHIYAIKAERDAGGGEKSTDVRWVRLISGRVVDLEF